jgi:hypothetical protein
MCIIIIATLFQDSSELIQHHVSLEADSNSSKCELALGKVVVSMVFRPVASVGRSSPECHVTTVGGAATRSAVAGGVAKVKGGRGFKLTSGSRFGQNEGMYVRREKGEGEVKVCLLVSRC